MQDGVYGVRQVVQKLYSFCIFDDPCTQHRLCRTSMLHPLLETLYLLRLPIRDLEGSVRPLRGTFNNS